jgi:hypothetical protein
MTEAIALARHYFDLSNDGKLDDIAFLFTDSTTYSSQKTGIFLGATQIIEMQRAFFADFESVEWTIKSTQEIRSDIVLFDFDFVGVTQDGARVARSGLEYIVVYEGKIQHIEVRWNA